MYNYYVSETNIFFSLSQSQSQTHSHTHPSLFLNGWCEEINFGNFKFFSKTTHTKNSINRDMNDILEGFEESLDDLKDPDKGKITVLTKIVRCTFSC